ncbi:MAG TPA: hypothetical protein VIJ28_11200 [Chloroflexota bacterium]|jgi:peptide chain release factor subunit 1
MRDLMRQLAAFEPGTEPVLSVYLDMGPHETGENPAVRTGLIVLKDRLRQIEKTLWPRGAAFDSFQADAARIDQYLADEFPPAAYGLALFACAGRDLFEVVTAGTPFENQVSAGPVPDLFQLARLLEEQETAVVAVVDTNTARLFVTRLGSLEEVDRTTRRYLKNPIGGSNQNKYQRHIARHRANVAREVAAEIERVVDREGAVRVILAGDAVAIPLLREALSPPIADMLEDVRRIDILAPRQEIEHEIAPILARAEAAGSRSLADQLIDAVRADGLGVVGLEPTLWALEHGQADVLLLASEAPIDEETRGDLVRLATTTDADMEVVRDHARFHHLGGVGALLRYRHEQEALAPEGRTQTHLTDRARMDGGRQTVSATR